MVANRDLKVHCNKYHEKYHSLRETHFKNQFRIQELEDSRDALFESNQRQKVNVNKYLDMIRKQNERIKQMEGSMRLQLAVRGAQPSGGDLDVLKLENERLRKECHEQQEKLNEAYNIIDELEFELETVRLVGMPKLDQLISLRKCLSQQLDFVEADRDHLQKELKDARVALEELRKSSMPSSEASEEVKENVKIHIVVKFKFTIKLSPFLYTKQLFNRFSSLAVDGGGSAISTEDGSSASGVAVVDEDKPAFSAFSVVAPEEAPETPDDVDHNNLQADPNGKSGFMTGAEEAAALVKANEWKLRRQELHKRLEVLHQRQQI